MCLRDYEVFKIAANGPSTMGVAYNTCPARKSERNTVKYSELKPFF